MSEHGCKSWYEIAIMQLAAHDGVENIDLRTHVARCPECRRRARELRWLETLVLPEGDRPQISRGDCPPVEDVASLADGHLSADARATVVDHLVECGACATLWEYLCAGHMGTAPPETAREPPSGSRSRTRWVAAGVILLACVATILVRPPVRISGPGAHVSRGAETHLPVSVSGSTDSGSAELTFSRVTGAVRFRVTVWDDLGSVLVERSIGAEPDSGTVIVTLDSRAEAWEVVAFGRDGIPVARAAGVLDGSLP